MYLTLHFTSATFDSGYFMQCALHMPRIPFSLWAALNSEQLLFPFQATTSRHFKSYASGKHAQCSATDETNFQILGLFTGKDGW